MRQELLDVGRLVADRFDILTSYAGFRLTSRDRYGVRFERDGIFVSVGIDPRSSEMSLEFGRTGLIGSFLLEELSAIRPELPPVTSRIVARQGSEIDAFLDRLTKEARPLLNAITELTDSEFEKLAAFQSERIETELERARLKGERRRRLRAQRRC